MLIFSLGRLDHRNEVFNFLKLSAVWIVSSEESVAKGVDVLQNCNAHLQKTLSFARSEETSFLLPHSKELRVLFRKLQQAQSGSLQFIKIQIHTHLIQLGTYFCDIFLIS